MSWIKPCGSNYRSASSPKGASAVLLCSCCQAYMYMLLCTHSCLVDQRESIVSLRMMRILDTTQFFQWIHEFDENQMNNAYR